MNVSFLDSRLSPESAALTGLVATADTTAVVTFPGSALIHYAFAGPNGYFRLALEPTSISGSILESGTALLYANIEPFSLNSGFADTPEQGSFRIAAPALTILFTSRIGRSQE